MTARLDERRNHYRVRTALPVFLGSTRGVLRDMSTTGAYFWTNGSHAVGEQLIFSVQLHSPEGKTAWSCRADVVRVEPRDGDTGVAVKITRTTVAPQERRSTSEADHRKAPSRRR